MFYEKKEEYFFAVKEYNPLQYPLHVHQYIEYVRAEKGFLEMQIGKETYLIQEGDVAVIFPNVTHDYHTLSTTGNTQLNIINGYLDLLPLHKKLLLSKYPLTPVIRKEDLHEDVLFAEKRLFEIKAKEENLPLISSCYVNYVQIYSLQTIKTSPLRILSVRLSLILPVIFRKN